MFPVWNVCLLQLTSATVEGQKANRGRFCVQYHIWYFTVCIQDDSKLKVNIFGGDTVGQCQKGRFNFWFDSETELSEYIHTQSLLMVNTLRTGDADLGFLHYNCARRMTQICVFNTRLFSLHNTLNYAIHWACLWMVLLTDVYTNLTSLWIKL